MQIKNGVILNGLQKEMLLAIHSCEIIWLGEGRNEGVTITSALDGVHSRQSYHYTGYAIDVRTRYFTPSQIVRCVKQLNKLLGYPYDVVVEKTHIHIEYDWKKLLKEKYNA